MKKKIIITIIVVLSLFTIISVWLLSSYNKSNPWRAKTIGDIPVPAGFSRVEADAGSYAYEIYIIGPFHSNKNELRC